MGLTIVLVAIVVVFAIMLVPMLLLSFFRFSIIRSPFLVEGCDTSKRWCEKRIESGNYIGISRLKCEKEDLYLFMRGVWLVPFPTSVVQKIHVLYPGKRIVVDRNVCIALFVFSEIPKVFISTTFVSGNCDMFHFGQSEEKLPLSNSTNNKVRNYICSLAGKRYAVIQVNFSNAERCEIWLDCELP